MKKTAWFPGNVKPVHKGWYEVKLFLGGIHRRRLTKVEFLGRHWDGCVWDCDEWRGLVAPPK